MYQLAETLIVSAGLLMATGLVPGRWCKKLQFKLRDGVTLLAGLQTLLALAITLMNVTGAWWGTGPFTEPVRIDVGGVQWLLLDGTSSLMFALVSFVGWVICRYSVRFLDGEPELGNYYRWTALTIGAVSLMALSGNLLLFIAAWALASLGLHHLLLFYRERPAARRAAWNKFIVSRTGDLCLLIAAILIYLECQTLNFSPLFEQLSGSGSTESMPLMCGVWLLVIGAAIKTAQFPFHSWLPQTLETPTPVSALMHAGIVNAGGYLLIRTSPLVQLVPAALACLVLIGTLTVCIAATSMLAQNSVKKKLAYSTVAQMGFMMLQCGLGAFSAAMLHLLAHSFYKAYAFLSSGSVLEQKRALGRGAEPVQTVPVSPWKLLLTTGGVVLGFLAVLSLFGINPATKPGGILLGLVVCLALTGWLKQAWQTGDYLLVLRTSWAAGGVCLLYCLAFLTVDRLVTPTPVTSLADPSLLMIGGPAVLVVLGFTSLLLLNDRLTQSRRSEWMNALYIHALNGFYVEAWFRQRLGHLLKQ